MKKDNKKALYESIMKTVSVQVKKALNESAGDGWDEEELDFLMEILSEAYDIKYEIESCYRGAYTNCTTYEELSNRVRELGESLIDAADTLTEMDGPFDDDEDEPANDDDYLVNEPLDDEED